MWISNRLHFIDKKPIEISLFTRLCLNNFFSTTIKNQQNEEGI